jgi:hypothetical protein
VEYAEQIPDYGRVDIRKASERAYVQYLNKLRVDLFNRFVDGFEQQRKTYRIAQNYTKQPRKYINNITGSGSLPKIKEALTLSSLRQYSMLRYSRQDQWRQEYRCLTQFILEHCPKELKIAVR